MLLDVLGPDAERGRAHAPLLVRAGGSAVNAARAARRAGSSAAVVGRVGDDPVGVALADALRREGIDALLAVDRELPTGCLVALGERVVASRGATAALAPADVASVRARVVLVSGYALLHDDTRAAAVAALASDALTCVDLASARLVERAGDDLDRLLADADVVTGDAAAIDAAGGLERLADGRRAAARTSGADGAEALAGTERASAEPPVRLDASPWGAGDAFVATFALALADDQPLAEALEAACVAGAAA